LEYLHFRGFSRVQRRRSCWSSNGSSNGRLWHLPLERVLDHRKTPCSGSYAVM